MSEPITADMVAAMIWDIARYAAAQGRKGRSSTEVADECTARWEIVRAKVAEDRGGQS